MKKITKIIIIVLIVILLSLAVCFSYKKIKVVREEKSREETTTVLGEDNYILNKNDGSKVNKSTKIIEDREVEGYKIENFDVIRNKETLTVGLDFVNDTEETKNERKASITFVDAQNNEIKTINNITIPKIEQGQTRRITLNTKYTDIVNAYDYKLNIE